MSRYAPANLLAAAWAAVALFQVRRHLRRRSLSDLRVARVLRPPKLPESALRGVKAVLRRGHATCLERSLVLQRWHVSHGTRRDVVIGVLAPEGRVAAHAWLDGDDAEQGEFEELRRLAAP